MRLLTWNVWFGGHMFDERRDALVAELGERRPDVIALQEVTPELLPALVEARWASDYRFSDRTGETIDDYGVVVLSRVKVAGFEVLPLPSSMGRKLVVARLASGLTVASVHLESTADCVADRVAQLALIQPFLADATDVVLVGDLNFTPDAPAETAALDPAWRDVWADLHPSDPGYTVDTDRNLMRFQVKSKPTRKRIDRVLLRSPRWRATRIELVGTAPIDIDDTFISDHFGLEAELR